MELLQSKKFNLPAIYFIEERKDIKLLPIGVPFIYGTKRDKPYIIRMLEYEVIWKKAQATKLPFKFDKLLREAGFSKVKSFGTGGGDYYVDHVSEKTIEELCDDDFEITYDNLELDPEGKLDEFIEDISCYVDTETLKALNVFPVWYENVEKAVSINIQNFAVYDHNMYNKKLDGMYGGLTFSDPSKNLIIVDISGSIPKAVATTTLVTSRNLAESFYADILITGAISKFYDYSEIHTMDFDTIYREIGQNNDQAYFKALVSQPKVYQTAIVFGDGDHPGSKWSYDTDTDISDEDGKKLCQWKVNKLISFHTKNNFDLAGYSRWFNVKETQKIADWVQYLES